VSTQTVIDVLAKRLAARGVKRFFGIPGGDCSLDLIDSAARFGIEFVPARTCCRCCIPGTSLSRANP